MTDATVTLVAKTDGKTPWHFPAPETFAKDAQRTLCGLTFTRGNWHVVDDVDRRVVRHANRPVCESCIRHAAKTAAKAAIPLEGQTNDLTDRERVLMLWSAGSMPEFDGDTRAAWRVRKDEYGYWLDGRHEGMRAWGIERKLTKPEAVGLMAQIIKRVPEARDYREDENMARSTKTQTAAASRKKAASRKSTRATSTRAATRNAGGSMAQAQATANETKELLATLNEAATAKVKGIKIQPSKAGGKRYYRLDKKTLAVAIVGARGVNLRVGKGQPVKVTEGNVEQAAAKIAKAAEDSAK